jgi:hypothetical protein
MYVLSDPLILITFIFSHKFGVNDHPFSGLVRFFAIGGIYLEEDLNL